MVCQETQKLIHGYLDGELDLVRTLEIERHLQECPHCERAYKNHEAVRSVMRSGSLYFQPPEDFSRRVRSALPQAPVAKPREVARPRTWPMWWPPTWGLAALAGSLAVVALLLWRTVPSRPSPDDVLTQEVLSSHVRSLMANHLTDVPSSDQHTVKPWFNGKLDFSPPVPDLGSQGFPLVGGRLDYLEDRPVAALVYQRRKHFINLFIWPAGHSSREMTVMRQGYNLVRWSQDGMNFWAVSDLNYSELREFVGLVRTRFTPSHS